MRVLDVPLSKFWPGDRRFWWPNQDGFYSVKSGYWLAMLGNTQAWNNGAGPNDTELWKGVWSIDGPNKLKHFVWRACKGSMAVKERLYHRHITTDNVCQICGEEETIIHSLFFCKYAMDI